MAPFCRYAVVRSVLALNTIMLHQICFDAYPSLFASWYLSLIYSLSTSLCLILPSLYLGFWVVFSCSLARSRSLSLSLTLSLSLSTCFSHALQYYSGPSSQHGCKMVVKRNDSFERFQCGITITPKVHALLLVCLLPLYVVEGLS